MSNYVLAISESFKSQIERKQTVRKICIKIRNYLSQSFHANNVVGIAAAVVIANLILDVIR